MQVDAGQAKCRREQARGGFPVGTESFPIEEQFGVEFPGLQAARTVRTSLSVTFRIPGDLTRRTPSQTPRQPAGIAPAAWIAV